MKRIFQKLTHGSVIVWALLSATFAFSKTVTLRWSEVPGAKEYEIEIFKSQELFETKKVSGKEKLFRRKLSPGIYQYHVRAIDEHEEPGTWTDIQEFVVPLPPPVVVAPFESPRPMEAGKSETLKWEKVKGAKGYQVEWETPKGIKKSEKTKETTLTIDAPDPGTYLWSSRAFQGEKSAVQSFNRVAAEKPREVAAAPPAPIIRKDLVARAQVTLDSPIEKTAFHPMLGTSILINQNEPIALFTRLSLSLGKRASGDKCAVIEPGAGATFRVANWRIHTVANYQMWAAAGLSSFFVPSFEVELPLGDHFLRPLTGVGLAYARNFGSDFFKDSVRIAFIFQL